MISREVLDEIRNRTSLLEVVGRYVSLKKKGRDYWGLCPFHGERSPSFHVREDRRIFYCFGCQIHGDVFKFLTEIENQPFIEIVQELAARCQIQLPEREFDQEQQKRQSERDSIMNALEVATNFYERTLETHERGKAYLERRGVPLETAREFRLGYAPPGWDSLVRYLQRLKIDMRTAFHAGLVVEREGGGYYDRLRDRFIFPICNPAGKVIAFGGRVIEDSPGSAKYLNTPETQVFNKAAALFGLHIARRWIGQSDCALMVEGNFDTVSLHAAQLTHAVATCGTAITRSHLRVLRRYTKQVVLITDGDKAGRASAERSLQHFLDEDIWPLYVELPEGRDPDDLVREEGGEVFWKRVERAVPLLDHLIAKKAKEAAGSAIRAESAIEDLAGILLRLPVGRLEYYVGQVAQHFGVGEVTVQAACDRVQHRSLEPDIVAVSEAEIKPPLPVADRFLLHWLMQAPDQILPTVEESNLLEFMSDGRVQRIFGWAMRHWKTGETIQPATIISMLPEQEGAFAAFLSRCCVEDLPIGSVENTEKALIQSVLAMKDQVLQEESRRLQAEIAASAMSGEIGKLAALAARKLEIDRARSDLKHRRSWR